MDQINNNRKGKTQGRKNTGPLATIRCGQINLQHSRAATANLKKLIEQDNLDIIFLQEPYLYKNRMAGLTKSARNYISTEDKSRAAILITNNKIDAVKLRQCTYWAEIQQY